MHVGHGHHHEHEHSHDHAHEHEHTHADAAKNLALLKYMLEHNKQHAEELHEMAHALTHAGNDEAAQLIHESIDDFNTGNEKIAEALKLLEK